MTHEDLDSIQDAKQWLGANGAEQSLLLGNGFSRAVADANFNYAEICRTITKGDRIEAGVKNFIMNSDTNDVEILMQRITLTIETLELLDQQAASNIIERLLAARHSLSDSMATAITTQHPDFDKIQRCGWNFITDILTSSREVYTLNYDLLLYWHFMKSEEFDSKKATVSRMRLDDGFGKSGGSELTWPSNREVAQNLHYLHGAIHLHVDPLTRVVAKLTRDGAGNLLANIRNHIHQGKAPHVVLGASSREKLKQIHSSTYLNRCLESLKANTDNMLIYGSSLAENDNHIFQALQSVTNNKSRRFVVSYHASESDPNHHKMRAKEVLTKNANNGASPELKFLKVK